MMFRKRPVEVEAIQVSTIVTGAIEFLPQWVLEARRGEVLRPCTPTSLYVHTLEGLMTAGAGDWIIRGVKGELYPCKADIFVLTYEPVDDVWAGQAPGKADE